MEIPEQDAVRDQFTKDLARLLRGGCPVSTAADAHSADAQLNASYRKALTWAAGKDNLTTIKPEDVRKARRAWLVCRDAFSRFAAAAAPAVGVDAGLARLTRLRTAQSDTLIG